MTAGTTGAGAGVPAAGRWRHRFLQFLWYRRHEGLPARLLLAPLWLLSLVFGLAVCARHRRYRRPGRARAASRARVISVGNLTVGGAGKTPVAIEVARRLVAAGRPTAVLSRGYGRRDEGATVTVSDGQRVLASVEQAGDEPLLIARACPGVPVLVGPDRVRLAELAERQFGAEVLVLDDGFQHLRLRRELDIVVVDASNPWGNGHLMPRGPLRERPGALARAGLVWLSKVDQAAPADVERLAAQCRTLTGREPVRSGYRVVEVASLQGRRLGGAEVLAGTRVLMLAGIARPESFRRTLEGAGAQVLEERIYPDHHGFTAGEVAAAIERARGLGADAVVLTEKDAVRLPTGLEGPLRVVRVEPAIHSGERSLAEVL